MARRRSLAPLATTLVRRPPRVLARSAVCAPSLSQLSRSLDARRLSALTCWPPLHVLPRSTSYRACPPAATACAPSLRQLPRSPKAVNAHVCRCCVRSCAIGREGEEREYRREQRMRKRDKKNILIFITWRRPLLCEIIFIDSSFLTWSSWKCT